MDKRKGFFIIGIVLSALWVAFVYVDLYLFGFGGTQLFIQKAIVPLIVLWWVGWIISSIMNKDNNSRDK